MSFRGHYREFQRADSLPEKFSVWRAVWEWFLCKTRNSLFLFGIFLIPAYLIGIGIWKFEKCGSEQETGNISLFLIMIGVVVLITALYLPIHMYAKSKAERSKEESEVALQEEKISSEEIALHIPCYMDRICKGAFYALLGLLPSLAVSLYRLDRKASCDPIIYWTAFSLSAIYCIWLGILILAGFVFGCLYFCAVCKEKSNFNSGAMESV